MATKYEIEEEEMIKEIVEAEIKNIEIRGATSVVSWNHHISISFNNQNIEIPF